MYLPSWHNGDVATSRRMSASPNLWDGLVGAWVPALGVTGGTLFDALGRIDGTLISIDPSTGWTVTSEGYALDLDGVADFIDLPSETIGTSLSKWSIVSLCQPADVSNGRVIVANDASGWNDDVIFGVRPELGAADVNTNNWGISHQDSTSSVRTVCQDVRDSTTDVRLVAATADGATLRLYMHGSLVDSTAKAGTNLDMDLSKGVFIGSTRNPYFRGFYGKVFSVYLYSRAITPSEVRQLYQDHLAPFRLRHISLGLVAGETPPSTFQPAWARGSNVMIGAGV